MTRQLIPVLFCGLFAVAPFTVGCDKTKSVETTTERKSDGSTSVQEKKVTQSPDGTVKEKTTERTNNP